MLEGDTFETYDVNGCTFKPRCNLKDRGCCKHYNRTKTNTGTYDCVYFDVENQQCTSDIALLETILEVLYATLYKEMKFTKEYRIQRLQQ